MNSVLICFSCGIVLLSVVDGLPVFSPEDVQFALQRCQNETTTNAPLRLLWKLWQFPNDKETHCYVKCFLEKLGLINLKHRGLEGRKICDHLEVEETYWPLFDQWLSQPLDGTCLSYYNKWNQLQKYLMFEVKRRFYVEEQDRLEYYELYPKWGKRFGTTAVDHCSSQSPFNWLQEVFKCEFHCVFKHFHYFDAYGRVDASEILHSFKEAEQDLTKPTKESVKKCVHRANAFFSRGPCDTAFELKICLFNSEIPNILYVLDYRNELTKFF